MVWKFSQVWVIKGQFVAREPKLVRVIGSFEKSRVREIGGEIIELEWSKSKGNKVWFEITGGPGNRGFEKLGFHYTNNFAVICTPLHQFFSLYTTTLYLLKRTCLLEESVCFIKTYTSFWFCSNNIFISSKTCLTRSSFKRDYSEN